MFSVKINVKVLLHIDVNGGLLPTGSSSPDYIDESLEGEKSDGKGEYSYAAEPPVQFRLSHLSRRSEPL